MKLRNLYGFIFALGLTVVASLNSPSAEARKIRTKHSIPKTSNSASPAEDSVRSEYRIFSMTSDSIAFCDTIRPLIRFYGFDKTVTSRMESFFISNGLDVDIRGMYIGITNTDLKGRQLHKRTVHLDCALPSEETRRYDIKSWDTQKSFYFHQSAKPKRQATPFDVRLELLAVIL